MISERAVVVDWKCIPYTDRGIIEWRNRLESVLGVPLSPQTIRIEKMDLLFKNRSSLELVNAAKEFSAGYILTKDIWHPDIEGEIVASEGEWILYKIGEDNV